MRLSTAIGLRALPLFRSFIQAALKSGALSYLGLYALQHRGEESSGIITRHGKKVHLLVSWPPQGMTLIGFVILSVRIAWSI